MKLRKQTGALLLAGALLTTLLPPAQAAEDLPTAAPGQISATLRLDMEQSLTVLQDRDLQVELLQNGQPLERASLCETRTPQLNDAHPISVTLRNRDGGTPAGEWPSYVDLLIENLSQGTYQLRFTGDGYRTYTTGNLTLTELSQHVTLGTGDATFTLGDLDGNGSVNAADRDLLCAALGSTAQSDLERYDLNGDQVIDIIDLSYVSRNVKAEGTESIQGTAVINPPVNLEDPTLVQLLRESGNSDPTAAMRDLFHPNGNSVQLKTGVAIPIELTQAQELAAVQIQLPVYDESYLSGNVEVEYEDGSTEALSIGEALPKDVHALGSNVIVIQLGKRVPVKKITITVTQTDEGFVTVESIQFLKDIVPENPVAPNSEIHNLKAVPGNERVNLTWNSLPNISGYRVDYWLKEATTPEVKSLPVNVNQAEVTGLENLETYCFTVTPTDGSWSGKTSAPVEATPQPSSVPKAPDMVTLGVLDGGLSVSWKEAENATYYKVFYQVKDSGDNWTQAGGQLSVTNTTLTDLVNDTTYSVYVISGNEIGESGPSRIYEGTPKATDYSRPAGIPTEGLVSADEIESIRLAAPNNVDTTSNPNTTPFPADVLIDGDFRTQWTAASWSGNEHIIITFKQPMDLTSAVWVPRRDGSYPNWLRVYSVTVWLDGDDLTAAGRLIVPDPQAGGRDDGATGNSSCMQTWPNVRNKTGFAFMPFGPVENVKQISIAAEQVAYNRVSCSELILMKYDENYCLPDDIAALFADTLYTRLADGVTAERIAELKTRLTEEQDYYLDISAMQDELNLAEELLNGSSSGVLINGIDSRAEKGEFGQSASILQPLGAAAAGSTSSQNPSEITIYAEGIPAGETVTVYASQFNAEVNAWRAEVGKLSNGRNILTIPKIGSQNTPRGGSLYLTYSGTSAETIKLHIRRATDIPMLDLSDWYDMSDAQRSEAITAYQTELNNYIASTKTQATFWNNVTEIATPSVLLSLPALAVQSGLGNGDAVTQLTNSVRAWEDIMHICKYTQGIGEGTYLPSEGTYQHNDMESRQNIRCMQMFGNAFMYAAGNHVGIGYGSCAGMVGGRPISQLNNASANSLFGWGIAHEIGHNMDKLGKAEITNNIYSIMVQTYDGQNNTLTSRLEASNKYAAAFKKVAQGYPGASGDVFVQLAMYWQLHLAYDEGGSPENAMSFYNKFFTAWKAGTYTSGATSYDDKVALTAAGVTGMDLTEFFTRWGMVLSDSTKATLRSNTQESRAIWYLSDQSRRERLNGTRQASGSLTVTAVKDGDKNVNLTITPSISGTLQGYEILRNDVPIDFVIDNGTSTYTYTDTIGSANHRTYTYTVKAYDILGYETAQADSGEIRIAYDDVLDPSAYDMVRDSDGTITFTMKDEDSVTGLKVNPAPGSGTFNIELAYTEEGAAQTANFTGDFAQNNQAVDDAGSYLTYFQVPGAASDDTRIWTYHPTEIVVTGIPDSADVQLIRYAGDDISFLDHEQGTVGTLAETYNYDGGSIPAGTLIIVGNYRGDPVYNTLKIQGRFTATSIGENGEGTETAPTERDLDGDILLFAAPPQTGEMTDISDGLFIFIPNVQKEAELQGVDAGTDCHATNLLPSEIRAVLYRTDDPNSENSPKRVTAETLWISSPGGNELPQIVLTN